MNIARQDQDIGKGRVEPIHTKIVRETAVQIFKVKI
jgi:hypothetical protein